MLIYSLKSMLTSHPRPKAPELEVPVLPELLSPSVIPRDVSVVHTFPHCPFQVILKIKTDHMFVFFYKRGPRKSVVTNVNSFISNQSIPVLSASSLRACVLTSGASAGRLRDHLPFSFPLLSQQYLI